MRKIAVVGAGVMGVDLAATAAFYGYEVILKDKDEDVLEKAKKIMKKNIRQYRMLSNELQTWDSKDIMSRISFTTDYTGFENVEWVIENVTEDIEVKSKVYKELNEVCSLGTYYGVNTSCISITQIASLMNEPDKVIGMHFMNPVPLKEAVETVIGFHTSEETINEARMLLNSMQKKLIKVNDFPGFVANRLSHLFMNEAAFLVQDHVANPENIDAIFRMGYAHKMGPLETADLIGLDTVVNSLDVLYKEYQDPKFRCCPLLKKMVAAGLLGRKSGRGFYKY
ncbi:3-hydroxyacyl-CoA dehydrogenase family protein [Cellulosilyticum ruminicola]|uniref:3-hydroxyacyl-CoA dehydrogenase family protein n=1 Tax=Cellulosilyticum ruminicola TaxID=425254 RepID=UPI0006D19EC5|nr:3-hydroxyacyl-CoA dehydrogenase family protein [Cellulosilyticum ruminicola]